MPAQNAYGRDEKEQNVAHHDVSECEIGETVARIMDVLGHQTRRSKGRFRWQVESSAPVRLKHVPLIGLQSGEQLNPVDDGCQRTRAHNLVLELQWLGIE